MASDWVLLWRCGGGVIVGGGLCAISTVQSRWYDQDVTIVKNPGEPTMEVIVKSGQEIETLNMSETAIEEDVVGTVGTIYEMKGGGMIYVPSK